MKHPAWVVAALACCGPTAGAFTVTVNPGSRMLFLQVGAGSMSGGTKYTTGGAGGGATPADNTNINKVSVSVPVVAALGTGSQVMTSNSTVAVSPYDAFTFCSPPAQVYVGGLYRNNVTTGSATLSVSTSTPLTNAASDQIPFTEISWASSGIGDTVTTIPGGIFSGGANQFLLTVPLNQWFESCLTFTYRNTAAYAAGTFNGRATYTLTAP